MYTVLKNVQIIIAKLKDFGIHHVVISPGSRNIPFTTSVENDSFFTCYSVVDERSAAFFGLGLIQELREPVAICCTSGTATCNYISAVTEAFYQKLPLVAITADRDEYCLNQLEDQEIPQMSLFKEITKKSVNIPIIESKRDYEYAVRLVNDALLEMNHHGMGPVHINMQIPISPKETDFSAAALPDIRTIQRHLLNNIDEVKRMVEKLEKAKKILVLYGQSAPVGEDKKKIIERFFHTFNCVIGTEMMSNLICEGCVDIDNSPNFCSGEFIREIKPEIVITVNGNYLSNYKGTFKNPIWEFEHWLVCEEGYVADPYHKLTDIFECETFDFFALMCELSHKKRDDYSYYKLWKDQVDSIPLPGDKYCDIYAVKKFMESIPEASMLHLANSNSIRLAQIFPVKNNVSVYCNRGTNGIDGSMSAFIGAAAVSKRLSFLLIGDLSFFYDMNGLWNRYVGRNLRIMLNNNSGAGIFHYIRSKEDFPNIDQHIAAEHDGEAKGWVESRGFKYLSATNKSELDSAMEQFVSPESDCPIFLEVFTDKEDDARALKEYYSSMQQGESLKRSLKRAVKKVLKK